MSIFPATDIISDVARAGDPQRVRDAVRRLEDLSAGNVHLAAPPNFAAEVARSRAAATGVQQLNLHSVAHSTPAHAMNLGPSQKFEAFILQSLLENILPKEEGGSFGTGPGASIWRSMMAEQLGAQLAAAGGIGMQPLLERKTGGHSATNG